MQDCLSDSESVDIEPSNACIKNPLLQLPKYFKNFKLLPTKNLMKPSVSASPCPPSSYNNDDEESTEKFTRLTAKPHSYPLIPMEDVKFHAHKLLKMFLIAAFVSLCRQCFISRLKEIYSALI